MMAPMQMFFPKKKKKELDVRAFVVKLDDRSLISTLMVGHY